MVGKERKNEKREQGKLLIDLEEPLIHLELEE